MKLWFEIMYYIIIAIIYIALAIFYYYNNYLVAGIIWTLCAIAWIVKIGIDILDIKRGDK